MDCSALSAPLMKLNQERSGLLTLVFLLQLNKSTLTTELSNKGCSQEGLSDLLTASSK